MLFTIPTILAAGLLTTVSHGLLLQAIGDEKVFDVPTRVTAGNNFELVKLAESPHHSIDEEHAAVVHRLGSYRRRQGLLRAADHGGLIFHASTVDEHGGEHDFYVTARAVRNNVVRLTGFTRDRDEYTGRSGTREELQAFTGREPLMKRDTKNNSLALPRLNGPEPNDD